MAQLAQQIWRRIFTDWNLKLKCQNPNVKGMSKPKNEIFDNETLNLIWHLPACRRQELCHLKFRIQRAVAETRRLPFDRLRASGGVSKSFDFSVHAELVEA
jgi:hypothetical protein